MSKTHIDQEKFSKIVKFSYKQFHIKKREKLTKDTVINRIVTYMKKELGENAD